MVENSHRGQEVSRVTGGKDFLDKKGLITQKSIKKLAEAGTVSAFLENKNQRDILKGLFDSAYHCEDESKIVDVGLLTGIQGSLVIQMLLNFGGEDFRGIAEQVARGELVGSFGVTEEGNSGSAAHKMTTTYKYNEEKKTYHIKTDPDHPKWFQGASMGDFMIVIAKNANSRQYSVFCVPQEKITSTSIETIGLKGIRYARNHIDCEVLEEDKLAEADLSEFPEFFIRSRLQLIGIKYGVIKKVVEIYKRVTESIKEKIPAELLEMDIKEKIAEILYESVADYVDPQESIENFSSMASIIKSIGSNMMYEVSEEMRRKCGATGFEKDHFAESISNASLPFTIFEGSNEMLFSNLVQKLRRIKRNNGNERKQPMSKEIEEYISKDAWGEIDEILKDKEGNTQFLGEMIALIFTRDQSVSREITSTEGNENDVVEFIDMKIAKLKLDLAFHKKHKVKN